MTEVTAGRILAANTAACVAAVLFGASVVATRVAVQTIPPLILAVLRFGQGGLLLIACSAAVAPGLLRIRHRDLPFLLLLGSIFFAVFPITFNAGLRLTTASRGALMLATMPLWSAWLSRAARRERLSPRQLGGVVLTFVGVGIVLAETGLALSETPRTLAGDGLLLVTAICGAVYGVLAQKAFVRYTAFTVTVYTMLLGTLVLLPVALAEGLLGRASRLEGTVLGLVIFLGVLGGAAGYFLWTFALTHLTPTQVAVYVNINPMVAAGLAALALGERLTAPFAAGLLAVVAGVLLVNWPASLRHARSTHP